MRLDRFLSDTGTATRTESAKAVRAGLVTVNGTRPKSASLHIDPERDVVVYQGKTVVYRQFTYLMLNKPDGYLSATEDSRDPTVLDLLPTELRRLNLFPCGRLAKNTLGFLLLTNDGDLAHKLLSPRYHVEKTYRYRCERPLSEADAAALEAGVDIGDCVTKPAKVQREADTVGTITVTEGKFHQIKRMFEAVENKIIGLERISFGGLVLDPTLARGEFRPLTEAEEAHLRRAAGER
jgi:16S rRNA pseudouridine516 synthase